MAYEKKNYIVYASVDGTDLGVFDTWAGGDSGSEDTRYTEGGGVEISLGGRQTREPITIGRLFKPERDLPLYEWLCSRRGKSDAVFRKQYLDDEDSPVGTPTIRRGKFIKVTDPESESGSSDPAVYELELSPTA